MAGGGFAIAGDYLNIGFGNFRKAARWFYCSVWNDLIGPQVLG